MVELNSNGLREPVSHALGSIILSGFAKILSHRELSNEHLPCMKVSFAHVLMVLGEVGVLLFLSFYN